MLHSHRCLIYFISNLQSVPQIDVLCNFRLIRFIFIIYFHIRCCIYYVCVCFHLSSVSISFFCWGLFRIYRVCVWVCLRDCRTIYSNRRTGCLCRLITRGGPQVFGLCRWVADFRFSFTSLFARQVGIEICVGDGTRRADLCLCMCVCACCFYSYFFISLFGVKHFSMLILCSVLAPSGLWIFFYEAAQRIADLELGKILWCSSGRQASYYIHATRAQIHTNTPTVQCVCTFL